MESVVKWRTGEPPKVGRYLITTKYGNVFTDVWYRKTDNLYDWERHFIDDVIAWYPISEIKPYKE